ncbi:MAG: helix-turn-helix domain-containing protein [Burkholderiaceae bacterium]|nr:helix-turn-helix domain-containing protein [Burkholderiaceae bacterium]
MTSSRAFARRRHWAVDVEQVQTIPGWDIRFLQTTAGRLEGESVDLYLDDLQLLYEDFRNVTTHCVGSAPQDSITIGVARRMRGVGRLDGLPWHEGVCAFDGRRELNSIVPPVHLLSIVLNRKLLCDYVRQTEHFDLEQGLTRGALMVNDPSVARRVAEPLLGLLSTLEGTPDLDAPDRRRAIRHSVLEVLGPFFADHFRSRGSTRRQGGHLEIVRRSREYVNARISYPLQVIDLCRAIGVSRRTLQTSFHDVLGIGPLAYLRTMRLNGARRMLRTADHGIKVRDVVETWGFWHPSRFSQDYQRMFGELPSQTLQQRRANRGCAGERPLQRPTCL